MMSLKQFKNIHQGETCYLLGDGPSIKWFDLSKFDDHITICCGNQMLHNDFSKLNIKYYTIPEPYLFWPKWMHKQYLKDYNKIVTEYRKIVDQRKDIEFFFNLSNLFSISGPNIHLIHRWIQKKDDKFTKLENIDPFGGSFYACLSLAFYMGFSKAYLIGFDAWTIQQRSPNRWHEFGLGKTENIEIQKMDDYVSILKKHMDLCSIVLDGRPYNMNSIKYEEYTGKPAKYMENHELASSKNLKILNTCPVYRTFKDSYL